MDDITLMGVGLAKRVFHLHGSAGVASVVFLKMLSRAQCDQFLKCPLPPALLRIHTHHWWLMRLPKWCHVRRCGLLP